MQTNGPHASTADGEEGSAAADSVRFAHDLQKHVVVKWQFWWAQACKAGIVYLCC